jgi:hypothetical protein
MMGNDEHKQSWSHRVRNDGASQEPRPPGIS